MEFLKKKIFIFLLVIIFPVLLYFSFVPVSPVMFDPIKIFVNKVQYRATYGYSKVFVYNTALVVSTTDSLPLQNAPKPLENSSTILKIAYVTGWSAGSKKYIDYLHGLITTTQINSVVIDVKDYSGIVSYNTGAKKAREYKAYWPEIGDISALITDLHNRGIYVIGRIVVFEDPILAKNRPDLAVYDTTKTTDPSKPVAWKNSDGLAWVDPANPQVWDYDIEIAKDALSHGFDEINFDYVRFPTDGNANNMGFAAWDKKIPKNFIIKSFFQKLRQSLPNAKISADLFGQTTTNTDDMGIGQILEDSFGYFDYICPMIYPSHYINGFLKFKNPADHPYEVISYELDGALARQKVYDALQEAKNKSDTNANVLSGEKLMATKNKIRPWLQDFNLGAVYDADMVSQEIKAVSDSMGKDFSGYMLWSPSNIYTQGAILKETAATP